MSDWIDINDRLPENNGRYLCWISHKQSMIETQQPKVKLLRDGIFGCRVIGGYRECVTHWMLLPEPPKGVSNTP